MSRNGRTMSLDDVVTDKKSEYEEPPATVVEKVRTLTKWIKESRITLFYTGAGISTAAEIPDYRGPNGVWTLTSQGKTVEKCTDMMSAQPTSTHMIMKQMYRNGNITHILSQNCDGLHLRSGLPQRGISEIHGNMYIEVCPKCKPTRQYIRHFDVTAKSAFRKHGTGRDCIVCKEELVDTIVHFGEVGKVDYPLNWTGTSKLVDDADLIVCIGTSLNVLKCYKFLFPTNESTKLVIVNLQWTPKDKYCTMKINAKADDVMSALATELSIVPSFYCRDCDPVLNPRRGARGGDLMAKITDCMCHIRVPRNRKCEDFEDYRESKAVELRQPGWWTAGIERMKQERCFKKRKKSEDEEETSEDKSCSNEASVDSGKSEETTQKVPRRKRRETTLERELRELALYLVNSVDKTEQIELFGPRPRGRPKKPNYTLSIEQPGCFTIPCDGDNPTIERESKASREGPAVKAPTKRRRSVAHKMANGEKRKKLDEVKPCSSNSDSDGESGSSGLSASEEEDDPVFRQQMRQYKFFAARNSTNQGTPTGASMSGRVTRAAWKKSSQASVAEERSAEIDAQRATVSSDIRETSPVRDCSVEEKSDTSEARTDDLEDEQFFRKTSNGVVNTGYDESMSTVENTTICSANFNSIKVGNEPKELCVPTSITEVSSTMNDILEKLENAGGIAIPSSSTSIATDAMVYKAADHLQYDSSSNDVEAENTSPGHLINSSELQSIEEDVKCVINQMIEKTELDNSDIGIN